MKAVEKTSTVQQVENSIRTYIQSDEVKVGDKLPTERQLCEELMVGRGTVREAIRILQAKGYLELKPGRGAFIAKKEESDKEDLANWFRNNEIEIKDCLEVRYAIEPLAVKLAIQKCTRKDIEKLRAIQIKAIKAVGENDAASLALCDEQFHTFIVECSQNKFLIDINRKINYSLSNFRAKTFNIPENVQNFIPAHEAILKAFEQKDPELGQKNLLTHLSWVSQDLEHSKYI